MQKLNWRHWATAIFAIVVPYTTLFLLTASHPIMGMVLWMSFLGFICSAFYK